MDSWYRNYNRTASTLIGMLAAGLTLAWIVSVLAWPDDREILIVLAMTSVLSCIACLLGAALVTHRMQLSLGSFRHVLEEVIDDSSGIDLSLTARNMSPELGQTLDRMRAHLRLRFAEMEAHRDHLRAVLDSMIEGVIAVDGTQRVLLVNRSACLLFHFQEESAVARPFFELVRNPRLQKWVDDALVVGEPVGGEIEMLSPVPRVLSTRVARLPGPSSPGALIVVSDVSQLRRLEGIRREFVANASHELKTPLASIKACVETLLDGAMDDMEHRLRFLQTIHEQTERLDKLVRDLMALTRIESEDMHLDIGPLPLERVVERCHERHSQHAERKGIALIMQPPEERLLVLADEEALEQILDNLLDNAIKYTNAGGRVVVRWRVFQQHCILDVEDTGIGIPQNQIDRIFERFYRVDRARSRELGGTGLGLSIVKHLIHVIGGNISVASRLGRGSTFTVQLPLAGVEWQPVPAPSPV